MKKRNSASPVPRPDCTPARSASPKMFRRQPKRTTFAGYRESRSSSTEAHYSADASNSDSTICTSLANRNSMSYEPNDAANRRRTPLSSEQTAAKTCEKIHRLETIAVAQEIRISALERNYNDIVNGVIPRNISKLASGTSAAAAESVDNAINDSPSTSHAAKQNI
ncbi:uncharacterized protein LOC117585553 [Drosophila guanche]|uniref:Uncharacterized protein n=1 Tax=Drosophila guanche TaxID=7266 RepID=A0A3B0K957_DROGU|nr:uncharacterized protein LOC117585553 [Drosophila guanche]SPP82609.1 Hypothetical predicted protein [Drosophila guanche]